MTPLKYALPTIGAAVSSLLLMHPVRSNAHVDGTGGTCVAAEGYPSPTFARRSFRHVTLTPSSACTGDGGIVVHALLHQGGCVPQMRRLVERLPCPDNLMAHGSDL